MHLQRPVYVSVYMYDGDACDWIIEGWRKQMVFNPEPADKTTINF